MMDGNGELHTCHRTFTYRGYLHPKFDSALEDEYNARLKCWARDVSSSGKEKSIIKMPISLTIQCSFILTTYKARTKPETWHHYLPPSTISKWTLSGVLGHIKYHLFPSNNIAFFCLTQLSVDVFFTKLQHSGGRSVCTAAAPHNTPQNTSCAYLAFRSQKLNATLLL